MLNEDLLDPKDAKIARLKLAIKHFKEYDVKRKNYYSESIQKLGELQSYVEELEDTDKCAKKIKDLNNKIKILCKEIKKLKSVIDHAKLEIPTDDNTLVRYSLEKDNYDLKAQIKNLSKKINKLNKINKELSNRICTLLYEKII